jgi:hypothetical protein
MAELTAEPGNRKFFLSAFCKGRSERDRSTGAAARKIFRRPGLLLAS